AGVSPARADGAAAVLNGKIYYVGGGNFSCGVFSAAQVYDPATNGWTTLPSLHTSRYELGAAELNGLIYAIGGNPGCGSPPGLNVVEVYDPVSNTWSNRTSLPVGGWGSAIASANGKIYVIGGSGSPTTTYAYDPATNGWATKASFPITNSFCGVAAVNGMIYVIGGTGTGPTNAVYAYNPTTDVWTAKSPMPTGRYDASVGAINGIIYVAGGSSPSGIKLTVVEAYDPQANSWSTNYAPLPAQVVGASGAAVSGQLYSIGGYNVNNTTVTNVKAFTPAAAASPIVITVPANITTEATGPSGAVVSFSTSATNSSGSVATTNVPASGSAFPLGTNTVTVTASAGGATTNKTFSVIVRDTTPPVIVLLGANPLTNFINTVFVDPGATASDIYAGNLTGSINVTGTVDTNTLGNYTLTYSVNDGNGNPASTDRTVVIVRPPPVLNSATSGNQTAFYWPTTGSNYVLQMTTNLTSPNWVQVTNGTPNICIVVTNALPAAFFRLQAP
ncbi:MAG TPA: kelch repeat-containing protein, partial [Desulfuromonadaceae bacterium]|nr:kelch repeat-containing protein [Desulfuromonadaceae bacterium]